MNTRIQLLARGMLTVAALATFVGTLRAAEQTRDYLYTKFQDGDIPTQDQFGTLIDSALNLIDDRFTLEGIVASPGGGAAFFGPGTTIDDQLSYGPAAGLSSEWAGQFGFMAVSFLENSETHYGYFQVQSGADGTGTLYPMQFQFFVFQDTPNTGLVTTQVPEPSTLVLLACGIAALVWTCLRRKNPAWR